MTEYDSTDDTMRHINRVRGLMEQFITALRTRALQHDATKLCEPEKGAFDKLTPGLARTTYGSTEYKAFLSQLAPALRHHYAHNSHHPEHYPEGLQGMDLLDLLEMLADWKAAGERHADGSLQRSLIANRERFAMSQEMVDLLTRTASKLGWLD